MTDISRRTLGEQCDSVLLGRLGRELAHVLDDTLRAPMPARLQALIDQLDPEMPARGPGAAKR